METAIILWLIGILFTMGIASVIAPPEKDKLVLFFGWIILTCTFVVAWPFFIGQKTAALLKGESVL